MGDSTSSLDLLWQQASAARDLALRALRQAEANAQAAELQGEQLDQYRSGYRSRWTTQFAHNGTAPLLHCYQVFGQRLNDVIGMQHGQTAQAQLTFVCRLTTNRLAISAPMLIILQATVLSISCVHPGNACNESKAML